MVDQKNKQRHLRFKAICGPKVNNSGKCLLLLITVLSSLERIVNSTYVIEKRFIKAILF